MLFREARFYYDCKGGFGGPCILLPAMCHATGLALLSSTYLGWPAVGLSRRCRDGEDPYDDDGHPATLLCTIVLPHFAFATPTLEINGLEVPNLCWAGRLRPPYEGREHLRRRRVQYLTEDEVTARQHLKIEGLARQRVVLIA